LKKTGPKIPDVEWIVGAPRKPPSLPYAYSWVEDPPREDGDYWVLNKLYNRMIAKASGELLISVQDFTSFEPEGLLKFWLHYRANPKAVVSGVGHKYADPSFTRRIWEDPRVRPELPSIYRCPFAFIEGNYLAVAKAAVLDVGGFDEALDRFAGMDWYSVLDRLDLRGGYDFMISQINVSYSVNHERYPDWEARNALHGPYQQRRKVYLGVDWVASSRSE
jgi:hypothetical protein